MPRFTLDKRVDYTLNSSFISNSLKVYESSDKLVGWYRLNENVSVSGDVTDSSGNGRTGTFASSANRPAFSGLSPSNFIQNSSCTFDADNDGINIGTASTWDGLIGASSSQKMSFSAWIRPVSDGEGSGPGGGNGTILNFGNDTKIYVGSEDTSTKTLRLFFAANYTGDGGIWQTANRIKMHDWNHVAVIFDAKSSSNNPTIYINGNSVAVNEVDTPSGSFAGIAGSGGFIGNNATASSTFDGQMADIAIWKDLLSSDEIQAIYQAAFGIPRKSSGTISTPPRLLLRERDNATGSYPTVLRVGDRDRKGNYGVSFSDNNVINYGRRIKEVFELKNRAGNGILGFEGVGSSTSVPRLGLDFSLGMQIRTEIISSKGEKAPTALVFSSAAKLSTGPRFVRTKEKIKNPRVRLKIIKGPYNEDRTILKFGLGLSLGKTTDVLKIQIDTNQNFTSPTTIKTIQNEGASILSQPFIRSFDSPRFPKRKVIEVNLHPSDFPGDMDPFYLRVVQDSISDVNESVWAISEMQIDYHKSDNITYPLGIDVNTVVGKKILSSAIASPHIVPELVGPGRSISGISDTHLTFTPGEDVSPFNESVVFANPSSVFFDQGVDPEIIPGFSAPVSSKTVFEVDLSPSTETTFGMNTPSTKDNIGPDEEDRGSRIEDNVDVKQMLMVYWNNNNRRWEKIANGVCGNAALGLTDTSLTSVNPSLTQMVSSGALGFSSIGMVSTGSDATLTNQNTVNQDALLSYVRPTSTFGFPFQGKYEATSSQFIKARDLGITKPFLLEKCSLDFSSKFEFASNQFDSGSRAYSLRAARNNGTNPSGHTNCDNQKVYIPTFFILKQCKDKFETIINSEIFANQTEFPFQQSISIPDNQVLLSTGSEFSVVEKTRELVTYGQMTLFVSGVANTAATNTEGRGDTNAQVNIDEIIDRGLGRDLNVDVLKSTGQASFDVANSQLSSLTGSFVMNFPCRLSPRIDRLSFTRVAVSYSHAPTRRNLAFLSLDNTMGGRGDGSVSSTSRSIVNGFGSTQKGEEFDHYTSAPGGKPLLLSPTDARFIDISSPYIIMPDDEIIFGWQYPMTSEILDAAPGKSDNFFNTMTPFGKSKLRLVGSLIKDNVEFHEGPNQNLSSDSVHEIIGAEPLVDQFAVSRMGENFGNFYDTGVSSQATTPSLRVGSETFSRQETILGDPGAATGKIVFNTAFRFDGKTGGLAIGDEIKITALAADGTTSIKTFEAHPTITDATRFRLMGSATTYNDAIATIFFLIASINTSGFFKTIPSAGAVTVLFRFGNIYAMELSVTQKHGGTAGNLPITLDQPGGTFAIDTVDFTGGEDGEVIRGNSFARDVRLTDALRTFTDSTGSAGAFFDKDANSTFGLMQAAAGGLSPGYYFSSKKYGNFIDFIDQGKDSKFSQNRRRRRRRPGRGSALQAPVRIRFVSGTNDDSIGVKNYVRKPPELSQNKTRTSELTSPFTDPSLAVNARDSQPEDT